MIVALIVAFAVWCCFQLQQDVNKIDLGRLVANWPALAVVGFLSVLNYALRALRWHLYIRDIALSIPWRFSCLAYVAGFAFTISPGKVGEMIRADYYWQSFRIKPSVVTGAFVVERALDLIVVVFLSLVALGGVGAYGRVFLIAILAVGLLLVLLAATPWHQLRHRLRDSCASLPWLRRTTSFALDMISSARELLTPHRLAVGTMLGVLAWSAEAIGLKILADHLTSIPLSWQLAVAIYATAVVIGALSFLPGGLGSTEAVMIGLLSVAGVPISDAIVLTVVCRLLTLWLAVIIGWIAVWTLRLQSRQTETS